MKLVCHCRNVRDRYLSVRQTNTQISSESMGKKKSEFKYWFKQVMTNPKQWLDILYWDVNNDFLKFKCSMKYLKKILLNEFSNCKMIKEIKSDF